jgi:hypothetical protein
MKKLYIIGIIMYSFYLGYLFNECLSGNFSTKITICTIVSIIGLITSINLIQNDKRSPLT